MERKLRLVESPPIVEIKELTKTFDTVTALDDVSLEIGEGKIIGLLGSNGSGKTTMLKILAGLCMKYEGQVHIDGKAPEHLQNQRLHTCRTEADCRKKWRSPR